MNSGLGSKKRASAHMLAVAGFGLALFTGGALAQPSEAQLSAIKSNCRSDFMANCMSTRPGTPEALHCLQSQVDILSGACKAAVSATIARPAAAAPPPAPPPKAAAAPPPQAVTPPPAAAAVEPAAPPPPKAAAAPKQKTKSATRVPARPPAAAPPPPAYSMDKIEGMTLNDRAMIVRACDDDKQAVCPLVMPGSNRILMCLAENAGALSARCKRAMTVLQ